MLLEELVVGHGLMELEQLLQASKGEQGGLYTLQETAAIGLATLNMQEGSL